MIDEITFFSLPEFIKDYQLGNEPIKKITNIAKINFLVGPNNSGKSRFLRGLTTMWHSYHSPDLSKKPDYFGKVDSAEIAVKKVEPEAVFSQLDEQSLKIDEFLKGTDVKFQLKFKERDTLYGV
jgi:AAA15 family ATPase/GTPase